MSHIGTHRFSFNSFPPWLLGVSRRRMKGSWTKLEEGRSIFILMASKEVKGGTRKV